MAFCTLPLPVHIIWFLSIFLLLPLLLLFSKKVAYVKRQSKLQQLPPGPPHLPILGNLHQIGPLLHQSFWELSKKYGPVMFLQLGRIPTVVISSAEAAREVLKTNDLACCSRPQLAGSGRLSYNYFDVAFSPYGDLWRNMRKLIVLQLLSLKRVLSFGFIREKEVDLLINSISQSSTSGVAVNLTDKLFALTANITFKMSFGFNYRGTNFDQNRFHEVIHDAEVVVGSISAEEYFPYVGWIVDRLTGHHTRVERVFHQLDNFFEHIIDDHLQPGRIKEQEDMIDVLLAIKKEQEAEGGAAHFTKDNIKAVLLNLFLGGVDTAAITVNWAMAELLKNPRVMKKAQDEVRNHVGKKGRVRESDIDELEYLKLVIKETLRLHPAAPLLLPRETMSPCKINGHNVNPGTMIYVNAWGIGRDPKYWDDPLDFFPERFRNIQRDYSGQNFEFLPFGAGRRICPGIHMGIITVEVVLANLLYCFDWKLPNEMKDDINMDEKVGVSLTITKKTALSLVPVSYLP